MPLEALREGSIGPVVLAVRAYTLRAPLERRTQRRPPGAMTCFAAATRRTPDVAPHAGVYGGRRSERGRRSRPIAHRFWICDQYIMQVAVLRLADLVRESHAGQQAEAQLKERVEALNQDVREQQRAASLAEAEARRIPEPQKAAEKQQEAARLRRAAEHAKQEAGIEAESMRKQLLEQTLQTVQPIIDTVAREQSVDLVLLAPNPGLAYFNPSLDITQTVRERFDTSSGAAEQANPHTHNQTKGARRGRGTSS